MALEVLEPRPAAVGRLGVSALLMASHRSAAPGAVPGRAPSGSGCLGRRVPPCRRGAGAAGQVAPGQVACLPYTGGSVTWEGRRSWELPLAMEMLTQPAVPWADQI